MITRCETSDEREAAIARFNSQGLKVWSRYVRDYSTKPLTSYWLVAGAGTLEEAKRELQQ